MTRQERGVQNIHINQKSVLVAFQYRAKGAVGDLLR